MTCRELAEFLGDYVAGELKADVRAAFERHLDLCVNCRRYLAHYQQAIELGRGAFAEADADADVPDSVPDDLVRAILEARSR